jgi:hypothetical protein
MPFPKKWIPIFSFMTVAFLCWIFEPLVPRPTVTWNTRVEAQARKEPDTRAIKIGLQRSQDVEIESEEDKKKNLLSVANMTFLPSTLKSIGQPYSKALVVPKTKDEDVEWIRESFPEDEYTKHAVYKVDDFLSTLHPPKNKGHEVMVYLSYCIDFYHNLSDVNIFMHSHRTTWHGNDLLENDSVQMIARLSSERVQREGFMNLRCHWDPGCPSWMHPGTIEEDVNKQEESMLAKSWSELFPLDPIPKVLAQPCCAQFAISKDRIQSLPLSRYVFYRDWLLRTNLSDYISGRVWEYIWQFVFTGQQVVCPLEHICYCDGFGVCFGGDEEYKVYYMKDSERKSAESDLKEWNEQQDRWRANPETQIQPEVGRDIELQGRINGLSAWQEQRRQRAKEHGDVAMNRAMEVGRDWKDGDGF